MLLACLMACPLWADTVHVAVASNFQPALVILGPEFEAQSGMRLRISAGSTGKHFAQILQGAPFDVFLAADAERPRRLEENQQIVPGSRITYTRGVLALWSPITTEETQLEVLLSEEPPLTLALANPRLAPYGAAAESWLRQQGLWARHQGHRVLGENVAQAYAFTATGNAQLGLVALSQLLSAAERPAGSWRVIPIDQYEVIEQQAVLLSESPGARQFLNWLLSNQTQKRLIPLGYEIRPQ